jgi:LAO/AO transport system kinase
MGGLAVHTAQVCDVLDAAGFTRVLIETVGVGQSELEVAQTADSTAVVLVPESGDAVQAMKAGLMEIGDLFVVNKADREGAERAVFSIRGALELRSVRSPWSVPVLLTVASAGTGVMELVDAFEEHLAFLAGRGDLEARRRGRLEQRLNDLLRDQLWTEFRGRLSEGEWNDAIHALVERRETPHQTAERLIARATAGR